MFRIFAYIALGILVITSLTIYIPPSSVIKQTNRKNDNTNLNKNVWKAIKSRQFIFGYILILFGLMYINFCTLEIKTIGNLFHYEDSQLSNLNAVGMGLSTFARFAGGPLLDKLRFKIFYSFLMVLAVIMSATFMLAASNWWVFSVYFCISLFLRGSSSVSQPIFFATVFGPEVAAQAFSYFFTA